MKQKLPYLKIEPSSDPSNDHMFGYEMDNSYTVGSFHIFAGEDLKSSTNSYSYNELT